MNARFIYRDTLTRAVTRTPTKQSTIGTDIRKETGMSVTTARAQAAKNARNSGIKDIAPSPHVIYHCSGDVRLSGHHHHGRRASTAKPLGSQSRTDGVFQPSLHATAGHALSSAVAATLKGQRKPVSLSDRSKVIAL